MSLWTHIFLCDNFMLQCCVKYLQLIVSHQFFDLVSDNCLGIRGIFCCIFLVITFSFSHGSFLHIYLYTKADSTNQSPIYIKPLFTLCDHSWPLCSNELFFLLLLFFGFFLSIIYIWKEFRIVQILYLVIICMHTAPCIYSCEIRTQLATKCIKYRVNCKKSQ